MIIPCFSSARRRAICGVMHLPLHGYKPGAKNIQTNALNESWSFSPARRMASPHIHASRNAAAAGMADDQQVPRTFSLRDRHIHRRKVP